MLADVDKINNSLGSIRTPTIRVDTGDLGTKTQAASASLTDLAGKLLGLPQGKVALDIGNAEQAAGTLSKTLTGLASTVGINTTALGGLTQVLGAGGLVAAAGAAVVALGALGAEMKGLDRQLQSLTGATGPKLDQMRSDFDALFRAIPADGGNIVKAQAILQQEFRQTGESATATITALDAMSRVMGGDLATNTKEVAKIFNAWQVDTKDQVATITDLVKVSQATGQSLGELAEGLSRAGLAGKELGLNIKETGVFLDIVSDAGLQSRAVFGSLREAMAKAAASGGETTNFFKDTVAAIQAMGSASEQAAAASLIFGKQAGPQLAALIRQGRLEIDGLVAEIDAADDPLASAFARGATAAAQFKTELNNLKKDLTPTALDVLTLAATIGTDLVGALRAAEQSVAAFMGSSAVQQFLGFLRQRAETNPLGLPAGRATDMFVAQPGPATGGGSFDAGAEAADLGTLNQELTETPKRLADVANGNRLLAEAAEQAGKAVAGLAEQLKAAGGDTALIEQLDAAATQTKTLDTAISTLTDRSLAAALQATKNLADQQFILTGSWEDWDAAVVTAQGHLDAQRASQAAANEEARQGAAAQKAIEDAMAKAATVAGDTYAAALNALANSVLPNLDAASATSLKQALLLGDQQAALGIIAQATGQSQEQLAAAISGTGAAAQEAATHAAALSKGFEGVLTDELTSRWTSGIGSLNSAVDAATAAQARLLEQTGRTKEALELLLTAVGAGANTSALVQGLEAGGAAAADAREKIAALVTFVRDHGQLTLKVDVDVANVQQQIGQLQQSFQEANTARAQAQSEATAQQMRTEKDFQEQRDTVRADLNTQLLDINAARSASASQFGSDLAAVTGAQNKALENVAVAERKAATDHAAAMQDAQNGLTLAFVNAQKTFSDGIQGLQAQAQQAIKTAADAATSGLAALSGAMSAFNQQQVQAAFTASVALQNAQQQQLALTPGFDPNDQRNRQNALLTQQIAAQGQAGLAQQNEAQKLAQAQNSVAQQQLTATKHLSDTMDELAKATQKLADQRQTEQLTAQTAASNARVAADKALKISQIGEDAFNFFNQSTAGVVIGPDGVPRVVTGTASRGQPVFGAGGAEELGITRGGQATAGTAGTRAGVDASARAQMDAAESRFNQRTAQLNKQEAAAQRRAEQQLEKLEETRKLQKDAFDKQERARAAAQAKAEKDFIEQKAKLDDQLTNLKAIRAAVEKAAGPSVQFGQTTIQETSKDMLTKAAQVAQTRLRV